jgi:hypothetical protein
MVYPSFARELENELAHLRAEVERLKGMASWAHTCIHHNDAERAGAACPCCAITRAEKAERELAAAKKRIADCEFVMAHRYDIIERQEPRCNEANARAEKAEADTARLDWLGKSSYAKFYEGPCVWRINGDEKTNGDTLREAIDIAMKEASK